MKKILFWGQICIALVIVLSSLAFVLPTSFYELDLLQSFAAHALVGYTGVALLCMLFRAWWWSASAGGAALVLLLFLHAYIVSPAPPQTADGHPFTVAHFNVLVSNQQYDRVVNQAVASEADLLSFQEVTPGWANELTQRLCDAYPYHQVVTDPHGARGLAIFSRYPLKNVQTRYWADVPNIVGDIDLTYPAEANRYEDDALIVGLPSDTLVHFVASHALSPRSESRYRRRNEHIRHIAGYLRSIDRPVLAIGDFNAVPWNPSIVAMKKKARLYDSRRTFTPTYPSRLRDGGLPIDYVFHSDDFTCLDFYAVSAAGSDHRGVVGTYRLKPAVL